MNRRQRRANEKAFWVAHANIVNLMKTDGDHCTFCRAPFTHNCPVFGANATGLTVGRAGASPR
jgi:hypothetical protein